MKKTAIRIKFDPEHETMIKFMEHWEDYNALTQLHLLQDTVRLLTSVHTELLAEQGLGGGGFSKERATQIATPKWL